MYDMCDMLNDSAIYGVVQVELKPLSSRRLRIVVASSTEAPTPLLNHFCLSKREEINKLLLTPS